MASPQKEDGHVEIANEIIEILAMTYLSSYESQVLWAIFRKTYGWQKKEDWITNTQLSKMTGIAESHVSRTMKKLIKRNIVIRKGKKISFQKDYDKWEKIPIQVTSKKLPKQDKKIPIQVTKDTHSGIKKIPKQVDTKETKETITKDTIQNKGDIFKITLQEFKKMRNKKKKPMTDLAVTMLLNKLDGLTNNTNEQIKIMKESILHAWDSVYLINNKTQNDEKKPDWKPTPKISDAQHKKNKENITKARKQFLEIAKKGKGKNNDE